jgi:hypothetical protein
LLIQFFPSSALRNVKQVHLGHEFASLALVKFSLFALCALGQQPLDDEYEAAPPSTTPCCPFNAPHAGSVGGREGSRLCDEADPPIGATNNPLLFSDLTQPLLDLETPP